MMALLLYVCYRLTFVYIWCSVYGFCDVYVGRVGWCNNTHAPIVDLSLFPGIFNG